MSAPVKIALFSGLTLLPVAIVFVYGLVKRSSRGEGHDSVQGEYREVFWQSLRGLDYQAGRMNDQVAGLNGKKVAIPGFVVPLDDEDGGLAEFLLVPSPKACIHVPPPPPNQKKYAPPPPARPRRPR